MTRYYLPIISLIVASAVVTARSQQTNTNDWHPDTTLLDLAAKSHDRLNSDAASTLDHDVKRFYELLRDKKWRDTYELSAKAFREDTLESDYIATGVKYEKLWALVNYEVLSVKFQSFSSTNYDQAILICKFTELPDYADSYSTVYWHKEDGVWKCLSAGPSKLSIFTQMRPAIIDWR